MAMAKAMAIEGAVQFSSSCLIKAVHCFLKQFSQVQYIAVFSTCIALHFITFFFFFLSMKTCNVPSR